MEVDMDMEPEMQNTVALAEALGAAQVDGVPPVPHPAQVQAWTEETDYSEKYCDDIYEYRRVTVPRAMLQIFPQGRCMAESEWRSHGITMSRGWQHYDHHSPEANVLLFRRVLGTDPKSGQIPPEMAEKVQKREAYIAELEQMRQRMAQEQARRQEQVAMDMY
uniref:Cyclin-dependent kinases regulatory subunit n=1 Tax=Alexandrium catenella TaxID=2925 RepID=A0A7S1WVJ5_ALECA